MAAVRERRGGPRVQPGHTGWGPEAVLRPGRVVRLLNISGRGVLVESHVRLRPGTRAELQLVGRSTRRSIRGRIERCQVATLEPLRYHGAIVFDERLDVGNRDQDGDG